MPWRKAGEWKFSCPTERDRNLLSAVQAAAMFLMKHREHFPDNLVPRNAIQLSAFAIKVHDVFLNTNAVAADIAQAPRDSEIAKEVLKSYEKFEKRMRAA